MRIEADDLDGERAAEPGEPAAQREGDREPPVDVDPEPARHALVVDRGAHLRPETRVFERRATRGERDQQRGADQEQPVDAEAEAQNDTRPRR